MAKKKNVEERTPSADEIIEALSLEMGVTEEDNEAASEAEAEPASAPEAEAEEPAARPKKSAGDDAMAAMGGIFDVPSGGGSSKKKSSKKAADARPAEPSAKPKAEEKAAKAKGEAKNGVVKDPDVAGIAGVFDVGGSSGAVDPIDHLDDPLADGLDDKALEKFEKRAGGGTNKLLIGVIVIMAVGFGGTVIWMGGFGDDIVAVFNGTYRDKKDAEKRRAEEEFRKEQLEKLEKYGNLNITGTQHALFKVKLEGFSEPRPLYGNIPETNLYRPLRLPVIVQNLKIKKPISVIVESPGYQPNPMTLTQDVWSETALGEYQYQTNVYLQPQSPWHATEWNDRMLPFEDEDNIPAGTIRVESTPPGAKIKINQRLVVDKDGNPVVTPATVTHVPANPEDKKAEPKPLEINTPPDNGYRVDVFFDDPNMPVYLDVVQRALWTCEPKDDKEIGRLPKDARPALKCNYTFNLNADFNALKAEILRQKAEEEALKKDAEERMKINEAAEQAKEEK